MNNSYPKKFDISKITKNDQNILDDFYNRRNVFDKYILKNNLKIVSCPSCGYPTIGEHGSFEMCSVCEWEDDNQDDPDADEIWGGPNATLSLTESRLQIGKILYELAKKHIGTININPGEVLEILKTRDEAISAFKIKNISFATHINDPVWEEYAQLKKETLLTLIVK